MRDLWREGHALTLRRIAALVRWLPPDSAIARTQGGPGWTRVEFLLADVYGALAGKPHPALPHTGGDDHQHAQLVRLLKQRTAYHRRRKGS